MSFDVHAFATHRFGGHGGRLRITYHDHGPDWAELALPYSPELVGDPERGVLASGPVITLMDMATSLAVWAKRGLSCRTSRWTSASTISAPPRPAAR